MILAIESSCDETALALFDPARGLAGEWLHTQIALHERHGGVVPELAAREHLRHFPPLLGRVGAEGGDPPLERIAVTRGPGLAPCLALGVAAAKALAWQRGIPLVGVNHLRAHAWSPFISVHAEDPDGLGKRLEALLPHLGLIVSGGHTLLFRLGADRAISVLSSTRDDAAGEALDKGAKLLGLGYPGGPLIERAAAGGRNDAWDFPRGLLGKGGLDFSFSGLKTSLRYALAGMAAGEVKDRLPDLCASYQQAVMDALAGKTRLALRAGTYRSLGLSGGVAQNRLLRERLAEEAARARAAFLPVAPAQAGDNAGMVAFAAWADPAGTDSAGFGLTIDPALGLEG